MMKFCDSTFEKYKSLNIKKYERSAR